MNQSTDAQTEQEEFWSSEFGDEYIQRNQGNKLLASNINFFNEALSACGVINTCLEFGANIGMNIRALQLLFPEMQCSGIEINEGAATQLKSLLGDESVFHGPISQFQRDWKADLVLIKGVLIHVSPDQLMDVYTKLYKASNRYILVAEYYNPTPVAINYRGHSNKLFKRDFAGEMLDRFPQLHLMDYGFCYHRDVNYPQDDVTWFLLGKEEAWR